MNTITLLEKWGMHIGILLATLFTAAYIYTIRSLNHWKYKKIPYISAKFPFGSLSNMMMQRVSLTEFFWDFYKKTDGEKFVGFYSFLNPQILIRDVDIIKNVLVKDFNTFVDRGVYYNPEVDSLSAHLFAIEGAYWKNLRAKLSPTYTSGKMKIMFPTVKECATDLQNYISKLNEKSNDIELKDLTGRYGLDVISNTTLGLKGDNFVNNDSVLRKITKIFTAPSTLQMLRFSLTMVSKRIPQAINMRFVPKDTEDYFLHIVKESTKYRESNNVKRKDFMQLLIDLNKNDNNKGDGPKEGNQLQLTLKEMAAQCFVFVVAGYETTSITLGFCLYELAFNNEIQDKLLKEIDSLESDITYEKINQLTYLEMVINETLRKYPPLPFLQRECNRDYKLPSGEVIDKGTLCIVSVIGLQRDPKYFPNPEKFDPDRFSKENIGKIVPYTYMPFGEGPRICIGMRFAKMQIKLALVTMLLKFRVEKCEKTKPSLNWDKKTLLLNAEEGIWVRFEGRNGSVSN